MDIILVGAGVLSKLVIDIISYKENFNVIGIYDDTKRKGDIVNGYKILGKIEDIYCSTTINVVVCIGDQLFKKDLYSKLKRKGFSFPSIMAHNSVISKNAKIEEGCIIGFFTTVLYDSQIGFGSCILNNVSINHNTIIGENVLIGVGANIGNDCLIDNDVHISMGVTLLPNEKVELGKYIFLNGKIK